MSTRPNELSRTRQHRPEFFGLCCQVSQSSLGATGLVELFSREMGDFLTKLLLFEKTILGNGCVRMRFQEAGQGLVQ